MSAILEFINAMNQSDLSNFQKFYVGGKHLGWIHNKNLKYFADFGSVFEFKNETISLSSVYVTVKERTEKLNEVLKQMHDSGIIPNWRGEYFDVSENFGSEVILQVERAAVDILGINSYGVHGNAYKYINGELFLWVAKRSMDKANYPGCYDQIVAGGYTGGGYTPTEIFIKEGGEEAGISEELASKAKPIGCISYINERKDKCLTRDNVFIFDLETPENFKPIPVDGEVESFELLPASEVLNIVKNNQEIFKDNCILVVVDFLIRNGFITPTEPDYVEIIKRLHQ